MGFEAPETVSFMLGAGRVYIQLQHDHRGRESVSPLITSEDLSAPRYFQVGLIYGIWRVRCGAQDVNMKQLCNWPVYYHRLFSVTLHFLLCPTFTMSRPFMTVKKFICS